jgi:hypothetical protein
LNRQTLHQLDIMQKNEILEVEFNHGGIYQYFDVPENVYEELMNADSHGVYFSENIRNVYKYQKV